MLNLKRLNKTETDLINCLRATDAYYVPKKTTTHGQRKSNAAAKFKEAGYVVEVATASHHKDLQYRSTAKLWSAVSALSI